MNLSRRKLLKIGLLGSSTAALAGGLTVWSWWDVPPARSYQNLSSEEIIMVQALSRAAFPGGASIALDGGDASLHRFFDQLLTSMTSENRSLLKLFLEALDRLPLLSKGRYFTDCSEESQRELVESWLQSDNYLFRSAIQSVIVLLSIGYTSHPDVSVKLQSYFACGFGQ